MPSGAVPNFFWENAKLFRGCFTPSGARATKPPFFPIFYGVFPLADLESGGSLRVWKPSTVLLLRAFIV
jgi:hypothetical protein